MATLVFDIETSALPVEHFDETQQEYLFRELQKIPEGPERETRREEIARQFSLWPLTSQVVCIGMLNAESQRGQALFLAHESVQFAKSMCHAITLRQSGRPEARPYA